MRRCSSTTCGRVWIWQRWVTATDVSVTIVNVTAKMCDRLYSREVYWLICDGWLCLICPTSQVSTSNLIYRIRVNMPSYIYIFQFFSLTIRSKIFRLILRKALQMICPLIQNTRSMTAGHIQILKIGQKYCHKSQSQSNHLLIHCGRYWSLVIRDSIPFMLG